MIQSGRATENKAWLPKSSAFDAFTAYLLLQLFCSCLFSSLLVESYKFWYLLAYSWHLPGWIKQQLFALSRAALLDLSIPPLRLCTVFSGVEAISVTC